MKLYRLYMLGLCCTLLSGCITGIWTGASLFYDRHTAYHSLSDFELNAAANRALNKDDLFDCPECHIDLAVFNGDILLTGHLDTSELREEAYKRMMSVPGARRVFKKISIEPIRTNIMKDSLITAKIRSQIVADSEINPRAFKVVTSDGVVYLMGDVIPTQADWVVDIERNTAGVLTVVKLFKYYQLSDNAT